jgi:BirA family transcriptional regulator, biotin operon repressor / biotin---[acetyl-CoA-carboxylase] ligase
MKIIRKKALGSTNAYAEQQIAEGKIKEPCCIIAKCQSAGKGQGSNNWVTEAGKNLTFSMVCFPDFLPAEKQYYLNKAVALSVFEFIEELVPDKRISIKWPNDIYIGDYKTAGILIQAAIQKDVMKYAIIGIGINVNQEQFPEHLPNPTSIIQHTKKKTDLDSAIKRFLEFFQVRYEMIMNNRVAKTDRDYLKALYRFGQKSDFEYEGKRIIASISGVNEYGWLQLTTDDGKMLCGDMNKIKMIVGKRTDSSPLPW